MINSQSGKISAEAYIYAEKKENSFISVYFLRLIPILLGAAGTVFSFLSCFGQGISFVPAIVTISVCCLIFSAALSLGNRYGHIILTASGLAFLIFLLVNVQKICNGLATVMNIYAHAVNTKYESTDFIKLINPETASFDIQLFLVFACVLVSAAFCYGIIGGNLPIVLIVSVIPVEMCLFFGYAPNYAAFFAVLASWFAVFSLDLSMPENKPAYKKASAQCGLAAVILTAVCFFTGMTILGSGLYSRPALLDRIYDTVTDYLYGRSINEVFEDIKSNAEGRSGAINHGKLGDIDKITFNGRTVLNAKLPKSDSTIYLRGFTAAEYTGRSWEELSEDKLKQLNDITESFSTEGLIPQLLDGYSLNAVSKHIPTYSFTIKNTGANNKTLYLPYNITPNSLDNFTVSGSRLFPNGKQCSGKLYFPDSISGYKNILSTPWSSDKTTLSTDEEKYRAFVYDNYLGLPNSFKGADEVFTDKYYSFITDEGVVPGKSKLNEATVFGRKLYYIRSWLRDNCVYDLDAGKLPNGVDFVDHFLIETKKGSCSHFATAAVLLCRYTGIPARYTEGYIVKPNDFDAEASVGDYENIEITDLRAHAWAEIYIDGFGWYPLEFTSGYGNVQTALTTEQRKENITSSVTSASEAPDKNETQEHEDSQTEVSVSENASAGTDKVSSGATPFKPTSDRDGTSEVKPEISVTEPKVTTIGQKTNPLIIVLVFAAAGICVLILRKRLCESGYAAKTSAEPTISVRTSYKRAKRILSRLDAAYGGNITYSEYAEKISRLTCLTEEQGRELVGTALKAEFGGGSISEAEATRAAEITQILYNGYISKLKVFQRLYVKFILCL